MTVATIAFDWATAGADRDIFVWEVPEHVQREEQSVESEVRRLADAWHEETAFTSSLSELVASQHYLRIIGFGRSALVPILRMLEEGPDHWMAALEAITGENPVPEEHLGDIAMSTMDWLAWARANDIR